MARDFHDVRLQTPSKDNANGNTDFLSLLPEPATEHDRCWFSSLTPVDDVRYLLPPGLLASHSFFTEPLPGVGVEGLVPCFDKTISVVFFTFFSRTRAICKD